MFNILTKFSTRSSSTASVFPLLFFFLSLAYKVPFKYHGEKGKHSI